MSYQIILLLLFVFLLLLVCVITYYLHTTHMREKHYVEVFISLLIIITLALTLFYNFVTVQNIEYEQSLMKNNIDRKHNEQLISRKLAPKTLTDKYDITHIHDVIHTFSLWDNLLHSYQHTKYTLLNIAHRIALTSQHLTIADLEIWQLYKAIYHNITQEIGDAVFNNLTDNNLAVYLQQIMLNNKM